MRLAPYAVYPRSYVMILVQWVLATALATAAAVPLFYLLGMLSYDQDHELKLHALTVLSYLQHTAWGYIVTALLIGLCQWAVLRPHIPQARLWVLATFGGTVMAMILVYWMLLYRPIGESFSLVTLFGFLLVGIGQGLILSRNDVVLWKAVTIVLWLGTKLVATVVGFFVLAGRIYSPESLHLQTADLVMTGALGGAVFGLITGLFIAGKLTRPAA